ncbi:MAG: M28 family peptidase [Candidatus Pseudobacter hemicellulosilyticus]|uniref:M28 family peptidase n=1 Tax=Candidatus Pseudobacter hemicellulosilyticus TaxID=3121375 RepID=A0AAJ5WW36_9BACT|nr:MAG: M28 family peptidase [Pseudobacter sp.]
MNRNLTAPKIGFLIPLLLLFVCCKSRAGQQQQPATITAGSIATIRLDSITLISDLAFLSAPALEGRDAGSTGNSTARTYIAQRFDSLQLEKPGNIRFQSFEWNADKKVVNVLGMIKGSSFPDQYYVVSAHYDHVGMHGGKIYPGADDNASGTAALLAMAAWFKQHPPQHTLLFASFDGEEKGLVGSRNFVKDPPIPMEQVRLNINMDMVSRNDSNQIYACGSHHYPFLKPFIDSLRKLSTVNLLAGHDGGQGGQQDWTGQSDHFPFHQQHIPFLYFGVEDHPDYHQPTDTFDKIDPGFYYRVCNMIAEAILLLDRQEKW